MADEYITHIQRNKSKTNEDQTTESTTEMINTAETTINTKTLLNCLQAAENYSLNTLQSQSTAHEPISDTTNLLMQAQGERNKKNLSGKTKTYNEHTHTAYSVCACVCACMYMGTQSRLSR